MLLRRVIEHVNAQNWTAVALDFVIVVVGVFIGLQAANWNDARRDQERQELVQKRLESDFLLIKKELNESAASHEEVIVSLHTLQGAIRRGEAAPNEDTAIKIALNRGFSYPQFAQRSGTFIELLSSGRLDLIDDEHTRIAPVRYDENAKQRRFNLVQIREYLHTAVPNFNLYKVLGPINRNEQGQIALSTVVDFVIACLTVRQAGLNGLVARGRIELPTRGFSVRCSTN